MKLSDDSRRRLIEKITNLAYPRARSMMQVVYSLSSPGRLRPSDADTQMVYSYDQLQDQLKSCSDDELKKRLVKAQAEGRKRQEEEDKERDHVNALLVDAKAAQDRRGNPALQKRAESIAREMHNKGVRWPSKKKVALTMASQDRREATATTYERCFRKTWGKS